VSSDSISTGNYSKLIVFDMDSTLIDAECIDELARAAGVIDKVAGITERAMNGEIDYSGALTERVHLLKGLELNVAKDTLNRISLMPGAKELMSHLRSRGYRIAMLSGGFTLASDRIGKLLNIDYVFSNELIVENGCLTGEVIGPMTEDRSKELVFEQLSKENGVEPEDCIVVGDGANDICLFERSGYGIAFNPKPILRKYADVLITTKDLAAVIPVIDSLER